MGIGNVDKWLQTISIRQFLRWVAYYRVEPFGEDWVRTARATAYMLAALGAKVDDQFIEKFLPSYDPDREMTPDEIEAELRKLDRLR